MGFTVAVLAIVAFLVVLSRSGLPVALEGSREGLRLFLTTLPRLFGAFMLAGLFQVLLPRQLVAAWLSDASGFRGIVIASAAGAVTPGGPFVHFPVVAAVYKMGAGIAPIIAYLTAWSVIGIQRILVWELPILGPRLTITRIVISLPLPVLAGVAARWILARW